MLPQNQLKEFLRPIVAKEFPTELSTFEKAGDRVIDRVYTDGSSIKSHEDSSQFINRVLANKGSTSSEEDNARPHFIAETILVLKFVQAIAATYIALKKVWDSMHDASPIQREAKLKSEWQKQLIDAGVAENKAKSIVENFHHDLLNRLDVGNAS